MKNGSRFWGELGRWPRHLYQNTAVILYRYYAFGGGMWGKDTDTTNKDKPNHQNRNTHGATKAQSQANSKKTHTEEHKKALDHSLPKSLSASQIFSLGKSAGPELHYMVLYSHCIPCCEPRIDSLKERGRAYGKSLRWTPGTASYPLLDVRAHTEVSICAQKSMHIHTYIHLFYPNSE